MGVGAPRLTVTHLAHSSLGVPHCRPVAWPQPSCMCRGAASVSSVCSLLMASREVLHVVAGDWSIRHEREAKQDDVWNDS